MQLARQDTARKEETIKPLIRVTSQIGQTFRVNKSAAKAEILAIFSTGNEIVISREFNK